jgi:CCR4-NOT transcriptional complex subunit CAF120
MIDMQEYDSPVATQTHITSKSALTASKSSSLTSSSQPAVFEPRKKSISTVGKAVETPAETRDSDDEQTQAVEPSLVPSGNIANSQLKMVEPENTLQSYDENLDALAALTFLETEEDNKTKVNNQPTSPVPVSAVHIFPPEGQLEKVSEDGVDAQYRSSFTPSRKAAERLAKTLAQQAAHQAAVHKPGRSNGRTRTKSQGAWGDSSEEEEEEAEEEDDDDDVDSDGEPTNPPTRAGGSDQASAAGGHTSGNVRISSPYEPATDLGSPHQKAPAARYMQPGTSSGIFVLHDVGRDAHLV